MTPAPPLPPTPPLEDAIAAGQRRVNLIWECTQAFLAILVVGATIFAVIWGMMHDKEVSAFLAGICGTVTGFYFGRTNHEKTGGIGPRPHQEYIGR